MAALSYFADQVGDGEVGDFVDGMLDAVVQVAAAHVMEGREADERAILVNAIGERFDRALVRQLAEDAADGVKH